MTPQRTPGTCHAGDTGCGVYGGRPQAVDGTLNDVTLLSIASDSTIVGKLTIADGAVIRP